MSFIPVIVVTLAGVVAAAVQQVRLGIAQRHLAVLEGDVHELEAEKATAEKAQADAEEAVRRTDALLADVRRRYETVIAAKDQRIRDADEMAAQCLDGDAVRRMLQDAVAISADDPAPAGEPRLRLVTATGAPDGDDGGAA